MIKFETIQQENGAFLAHNILRKFYIHHTIYIFHSKIFYAYSKRRRLRISILPRNNYSNNPKYRTNNAHALIGFIIKGCVRRANNIGMSAEKKDKESKKVTERVIPIKRDDLFRNEVVADNIR